MLLCFFWRGLWGYRWFSFTIATLPPLSQGQPGSPGLKGESGDLGPQVVLRTYLIPPPRASLPVYVH